MKTGSHRPSIDQNASSSVRNASVSYSENLSSPTQLQSKRSGRLALDLHKGTPSARSGSYYSSLSKALRETGGLFYFPQHGGLRPAIPFWLLLVPLL